MAVLAYDKSDVCSAAAQANYESLKAELPRGTSLTLHYITRDIRCVTAKMRALNYLHALTMSRVSSSSHHRTLDRCQFYADVTLHLGGRIHVLCLSPPCGDLSWLNAYADGCYGPVGNLCFECFRLVEATHRMR